LRARGKGAAWFGWAASLALACSPANVAGPQDSSTIDQSAAQLACQEYAYARCGRLQACSRTAVPLRYGDEATCVSLYQDACIANIDAPGTGWTPAYAEGCAQNINSWTLCSDYINNQNPPPACARPMGKLEQGAACAVAGQCASGFCSVPLGSACGQCAPAPNPGDACATSADCGASLTCAEGGTCSTYGQAGTACGPSQACGAGLTCVGSGSAAQAFCQPATATQGAPCSFAGSGCDINMGLVCNAEAMQCVPADIVGSGKACGVVANQMATCGSGGTCTAGACVVGAPALAPCDIVNGPRCIGGTGLGRCVISRDGGTTGTCQIPSAARCAP
jgi:hypothetical protein